MKTSGDGRFDALWQSHDDRFNSESVLIIQINVAAGIQEANLPVADLPRRFLAPTFTS